jgi:trigger factor
MLQKEYEQESEYRFGIDARNYAIEKAAIALPEEFLKRWLHSANEGKFTMEQIEAEFGAFVKDFRWQLIRDNVMLAQDFKISSEDVMNEAKSIAQYQFAMYGMTNMPDEDIAKFAVQMLQDQEQARRIYEKLQNDKVVGYIRNTVTVENKEISVEELREMGR